MTSDHFGAVPGRMDGNRTPRVNRDQRQAELLRHAAIEVVQSGGFPVSFEKLARAADVSKALIYTYFPSQFSLGDALVAEASTLVDRRALAAAAALPNLTDAARECAFLYFDAVRERGALLHILLADAFLALAPDRAAFGRAALILLPLARRLRRELRLAPREATVVLQLLLTLPEEAGRKVFRGEADATLARRLAGETIEACLAAVDGRQPSAHIADALSIADFL